MTREEAIKEWIIPALKNTWNEKKNAEILKALEQEPKTDDYKQGWHDAIEKALKEAYTIHHYGDIFRVVQEETLIGVGMAYEQVSTEKTGHWKRISIDKYVQHAMAFYRCSECGKDIIGEHNYCPNCGAKMEVEE